MYKKLFTIIAILILSVTGFSQVHNYKSTFTETWSEKSSSKFPVASKLENVYITIDLETGKIRLLGNTFNKLYTITGMYTMEDMENAVIITTNVGLDILIKKEFILLQIRNSSEYIVLKGLQ